MNKSVAATNVKMFCSIRECCRHSMNRIQSKDHKIGTY